VCAHVFITEGQAPRRYELGGAGPAGPVESAARRARKSRGGVLSVATVYAHVNEERPAEYWDYDSLHVKWGYVFLLLAESQFGVVEERYHVTY
jgi:hypothetical protein